MLAQELDESKEFTLVDWVVEFSLNEFARPIDTWVDRVIGRGPLANPSADGEIRCIGEHKCFKSRVKVAKNRCRSETV